MPNEIEGLSLGDFVDALRSELRDAQTRTDPALPIEIGPVTVEFTLLTRAEVEGKAGIRFWVVDAGVGGRTASESTQKITMVLTPLDPAGGKARIRDIEKN